MMGRKYPPGFLSDEKWGGVSDVADGGTYKESVPC